MNPYTSIWTGVRGGDGPQEFHLVLLDNGRTDVLQEALGREALHCIRCSACLNVCPVYERTGGHAYGSVYPGPIGAVLAPQLSDMKSHHRLPYASSLCGACYDACPVKINIPKLLVHLRGEIVDGDRRSSKLGARLDPERLGMRLAARTFASRGRYEAAQKLVRAGQVPFVRSGKIHSLPGYLSRWTSARDLRAIPQRSFRDWWRVKQRG